jgi:hypothetical protein
MPAPPPAGAAPETNEFAADQSYPALFVAKKA